MESVFETVHSFPDGDRDRHSIPEDHHSFGGGSESSEWSSTSGSYRSVQRRLRREGRDAKPLVSWRIENERASLRQSSIGIDSSWKPRGRSAVGHFLSRPSPDGRSERPQERTRSSSRRNNLEEEEEEGTKTRQGGLLDEHEGAELEEHRLTDNSNSQDQLRWRLWAFLVDNLNRAVDDLYYSCEIDGSMDGCKEALRVLDCCRDDFENLIQRINVQQEFERQKQEADRFRVPKGVAWDVRKASPTLRNPPVMFSNNSNGSDFVTLRRASPSSVVRSPSKMSSVANYAQATISSSKKTTPKKSSSAARKSSSSSTSGSAHIPTVLSLHPSSSESLLPSDVDTTATVEEDGLVELVVETGDISPRNTEKSQEKSSKPAKMSFADAVRSRSNSSASEASDARPNTSFVASTISSASGPSSGHSVAQSRNKKDPSAKAHTNRSHHPSRKAWQDFTESNVCETNVNLETSLPSEKSCPSTPDRTCRVAESQQSITGVNSSPQHTLELSFDHAGVEEDLDPNTILDRMFGTVSNSLTWSEMIDTNRPLPPRSPVRNRLQQRLSSPERSQKPPEQVEQQLEERLKKAEENRARIQEERKNRATSSSARMKSIADKQSSTLKKKAAEVEERLDKADENRAAYVKEIRKKANNENLKVDEVLFIQNLSQEVAKSETLRSMERQKQKRMEKEKKLQENYDTVVMIDSDSMSMSDTENFMKNLGLSKNKKTISKRVRKIRQRISLHAKEYLENTIFGDSTQSLSTSEKPEIDTLIVEESSESESSIPPTLGEPTSSSSQYIGHPRIQRIFAELKSFVQAKRFQETRPLLHDLLRFLDGKSQELNAFRRLGGLDLLLHMISEFPAQTSSLVVKFTAQVLSVLVSQPENAQYIVRSGKISKLISWACSMIPKDDPSTPYITLSLIYCFSEGFLFDTSDDRELSSVAALKDDVFTLFMVSGGAELLHSRVSTAALKSSSSAGHVQLDPTAISSSVTLRCLQLLEVMTSFEESKLSLKPVYMRKKSIALQPENLQPLLYLCCSCAMAFLTSSLILPLVGPIGPLVASLSNLSFSSGVENSRSSTSSSIPAQSTVSSASSGKPAHASNDSSSSCPSTSASAATTLLPPLVNSSSLPVTSSSSDFSSIPISLSSTVCNMACICIRILNNVARVDLSYLQTFLDEEMRLEFGQILSLLMNYCSNHPDITSASSSTSLGFILENTLDGPLDSLCTIFSARDLLHELLLLAGYICIENPTSLEFFQSGKTRSPLQRMCGLPIAYFTNTRLKAVLLSSIIAACYDNEAGRVMVEQELSLDILRSFLDEEQESLLSESKSVTEGSSNSLSIHPKWLRSLRLPSGIALS